MKVKQFTVLFVGAEDGHLNERPVEAYGTLPVGRWVEEHILPIAAPDQPVHIIETPIMGHMVVNTPAWFPDSQTVEKVGC